MGRGAVLGGVLGAAALLCGCPDRSGAGTGTRDAGAAATMTAVGSATAPVAPGRVIEVPPNDAGYPPPREVAAPSEPVRLFREADLAFQKGELDHAWALVTESLHQDRDSFLAHNLAGRIAARTAGSQTHGTPVAEKEFRRTLELNPGFWPAYENLGDLALAQGRRKDAAGWYQKLLAARPDHPRKAELAALIEGAAPDAGVPGKHAAPRAGASRAPARP